MDSFTGKRVLILGGMGFIGSNLALRLVELGAEVTLADSMLPQYGGNVRNIASIQDRVRVNWSDIRDQYSLSYLVRDVDVIFSVAGQTSHVDSMTDPMTDLDINCRSQLSILEACRRHNPTVTIAYASTRQIYGKPHSLPVDESHPIQPADINGINKLAAEMYYTLYSQIYGMNCVSLRLTNTYGPRQHVAGSSQGFVGIFLRQAISGETIRIFGDGTQLRDFNYIDDVVEAFLLAVSTPACQGQVANLGADRYYSLLEFIECLHEFCDFEHTLVPFPPEHQRIDIGDYYADYSRFRRWTNWRPRVELREGLRRTVEFFRAERDHYWPRP